MDPQWTLAGPPRNRLRHLYHVTRTTATQTALDRCSELSNSLPLSPTNNQLNRAFTPITRKARSMTDLSVDLPTAADLREASVVTPQPPSTPRASAATTPTPAQPYTTTQASSDEGDITSLATLPTGRAADFQSPAASAASSPPPPLPKPPAVQSGWGWGGGFSWNGIVDAVKKQVT